MTVATVRSTARFWKCRVRGRHIGWDTAEEVVSRQGRHYKEGSRLEVTRCRLDPLIQGTWMAEESGLQQAWTGFYPDGTEFLHYPSQAKLMVYKCVLYVMDEAGIQCDENGQEIEFRPASRKTFLAKRTHLQVSAEWHERETSKLPYWKLKRLERQRCE